MAEENKKLNLFEEGTNDENIQDVIAKAGKVDEDIVKAAAEKIATRRKEQVTQELIEIVQKCEYTQMSTHISYKRSNKTNKKIKEYLKDLTDLKKSITEGGAPVSDWDKKAPALKQKLDKDLVEIGKEMDGLQRDLDELFPNSWSYRYNSLIPNRSR